MSFGSCEKSDSEEANSANIITIFRLFIMIKCKQHLTTVVDEGAFFYMTLVLFRCEILMSC